MTNYSHAKSKWSIILITILLLISFLLLSGGKANAQLDESHTKPPPADNRGPDIVGGNEADPGEWPWQVLLNPGGLCGGSLIDEEWVLTAAHCVVNSQGQVTSPGNVTLALGVHDRDQFTSDIQAFNVTQVIPHPNYNPSTFDSDVALLKLDGSATIVPGVVETVRLNTETNLAGGTLATVTGWGALSQGGNTSQILQEVSVPIVTNQVCNASYSGGITDNMICAGFQEGGKDACQGDSGGPFVISDGQGGWVQAGVVSWGNGCALPNFYGVYADVANFVEWIDQQTGMSTDPVEPPDPVDSGSELVVNGNFDGSIDGNWEEFSSNNYQIIGSFDTSLTPVSSPNMAWFGGANNEEAQIIQTIALPSSGTGNDTYTLSFYGFIFSQDECGFDVAGVLINGEAIQQYGLCAENNTTDWAQVEIDISSYAGQTISLMFAAITDESVESSFYVDSVSITYTEAAPPDQPGPTPGTGSVPNGDFELGDNGDWEQSSALDYQMIFSSVDGLSVDPYAGSYFAWLGGANNETANIQQTVTVPNDATSLEFYALIRSDDFCGYDAAAVYFGQNELITFDLCQETSSDSWQQVVLDISPYAGQTDALWFGMTTDGEFISSLYLDDIGLYTTEPEAPVEEEAAMELYAAAGSASIELDWTTPDDASIVQYNVLRQTQGSTTEFTQIGSTSQPFYSDQDESLEEGQTYLYKIQAVDETDTTVVESNVASASFGQVTLSIPSIIAPVGEEDLIAPLNILNASGLEVISSTVWIDYDMSHLTPTRFETTQLTNNYDVEGFLYDLGNGTGRMELIFEADNPPTIEGDGSFIWLYFDVIGDVGDRSSLEFVKAAPGGAGSFMIDQDDGEIGLIFEDGQIEIVGESDTANSFGDIDGDGTISNADAQAALDYSVGTISLNAAQIAAGDINGDGEVNAADAAMILYYVDNGSWPPAESNISVNQYEISLATLSQNAMSIGTTLSNVPVGGFEFTLNVDPSEIASLNFAPVFTNILVSINNQEDGKIKVAIASGTNFGEDLSTLGTITVTYNAARQMTNDASRVRLSDARLFSPSGLDYEANFPGTNASLVSTEISNTSTIFLPMIVR
ncbi:MAG: trypsin-like serine protease [Chloroflexota bacterium]